MKQQFKIMNQVAVLSRTSSHNSISWGAWLKDISAEVWTRHSNPMGQILAPCYTAWQLMNIYIIHKWPWPTLLSGTNPFSYDSLIASAEDISEFFRCLKTVLFSRGISRWVQLQLWEALYKFADTIQWHFYHCLDAQTTLTQRLL